MSEENEKMRMEPDRLSEPDEEKDVEGHQLGTPEQLGQLGREDQLGQLGRKDDVDAHQMGEPEQLGQLGNKDDDDDDVEGHQMSSQFTP